MKDIIIIGGGVAGMTAALYSLRNITWRGHANLIYSNWLNYFVYQSTPFDITEIK